MTIPGSILGRFSGGRSDPGEGTSSRFSGAGGVGKTSAANPVHNSPSTIPPINIE